MREREREREREEERGYGLPKYVLVFEFPTDVFTITLKE